MKEGEVLGFLRENTFVSVGCTDPLAIALAAAWAKSCVKGELESIQVAADKNVMKDAYGVKIPGVGEAGIPLAAALGWVVGQPEKGLLLLDEVSERQISEAQEIVAKNLVHFDILLEEEGIHVEAVVKTAQGTGKALIAGRHDRLSGLWWNQRLVRGADQDREEIPSPFRGEVPAMEKIIEIIEKIHTEKQDFLDQGFTMNMEAAKVGLNLTKDRLALGQRLRGLFGQMKDRDSLIGKIRVYTAAAADARMSGQRVPITGCFGSGNHGITLFIALGLLGENLGKERAVLLKALALGEMLTGYVKSRTGILTPHCGCSLAAGIGAAGGGAYLLGGDSRQVLQAVNLVTATLFGTVCDGAKEACALKISNAAATAVESALLAVTQNMQLAGQGVVGNSFSDTLSNIERMTVHGFANVDREMVDILQAGRFWQ